MGLFPKLRAIERASLQSMNSFKTLVQLTYFIKITCGKPESWIGEAGIGWHTWQMSLFVSFIKWTSAE